jgi:hypothetical protein
VKSSPSTISGVRISPLTQSRTFWAFQAAALFRAPSFGGQDSAPAIGARGIPNWASSVTRSQRSPMAEDRPDVVRRRKRWNGIQRRIEAKRMVLVDHIWTKTVLNAFLNES